MRSRPWQTFALPGMLAALVLTMAGCGGVKSKASPDAHGDAVVDFPDPSRARMPEGIFVNVENLRKIGPGMSKDQLYNLLGTPHFSEGVFGVRRWNYILDFRKQDGGSFSCQYQIVFDKNGRAANFYWKPESCKSVLAEPRPALPAAAATPLAMPAEPIRLSSDALFDFDRSDLTAQGREQLSGLLRQVQSASQIQNILIVGYTDRIGSGSYNRALSRRRAESVRTFLAEGGVSASAMRVEGRGEADPVVRCSHVRRHALITCLAPNRRVELSGVARP